MTVTKLQLQVLALSIGTVTNTGDIEDLDVTLGHARHQVINQCALHTPKSACLLGIISWLHRDGAFANNIADFIPHVQRQSALRPFDGEHTIRDVGADAARNSNRTFANAAHQNTSASTSPPTLAARASASESTPFGVETMEIPRPLRITGSSLLPE